MLNPPVAALATVLVAALANGQPVLGPHDPTAAAGPLPVEPTAPIPQAAEAPPSRQLLLELCAEPRLAGTAGGERGALWVAEQLRAAGWIAEIESRSLLLSLPRSIEFMASDPSGRALFQRRDRFDPDARPPGDMPPAHAWARSGIAIGPVVDVGRGLRTDFEALVEAGVELEGTIALARYGGAYRGVKVALAAEFGCSAALLFDHGDENGPGRGAVWPRGPWKPIRDAQRGSILSLTEAPGDPSTPGWPSPLLAGPAGSNEAPERAPLEGEALDARLPKIPSIPIGWAYAETLLAELAAGRRPTFALDLVMQVERRSVHNVIGRLLPAADSHEGEFVIAGTHRDAWVRGAQDSGTGVVTLLRAAQMLGQRVEAGWSPARELKLAFWDAEETGLMGSTEWAEAHADQIRRSCLAYLNGDACVSGIDLRASGMPGLLGTLEAAARRRPATRPAQTQAGHEPNLWEQFAGRAEDGQPQLGLPGSGSDYTVFLHHLGIPVLDLGFGGNGGGQYHTAVDDFAIVDQYLDPGFRGHEAAAGLFAELLFEISERGRASFDPAEAAAELARVLRGLEGGQQGPRAAGLARVFEAFLTLDADARQRAWPLVHAALLAGPGLPGRPWYKNELWAPGQETGYAAVLLPPTRRSLDPAASADDPLGDLRPLVEAFAPGRILETDALAHHPRLQRLFESASDADVAAWRLLFAELQP